MGSLLDIGCGDGIVGDTIDQNIRYRGLDLSEACLYEQNPDNPNILYVDPKKLFEILEQQEQHDVVLLLDVIEHTAGFTDLFEAAIQKTKTHIVVSLPNE